MKTKNNMIAGAMLCLLFSGCSGAIELVGYGPAVSAQDGLEARLVSNGKEGALLYVKNTSAEIVSMNQSPLAMTFTVLTNGQPVAPAEQIMIDMDTSPSPDAFVVITPGQTRTIPIPVSYAGHRYRAFDAFYRIRKGVLYDVDVQVNPYFGTFSRETADKTLTDFKIPGYRHRPIKANTLTIRSR
ncbi:MAG TPA: hypothetical protein PKM57_08450 [Kiritimatiellia bacterium]|nr:hypothetical protein [Kiritimatiellia bacterium]HPS07060.1 hypothetical protein [Kiritimatiellia bacterium]